MLVIRKPVKQRDTKLKLAKEISLSLTPRASVIQEAKTKTGKILKR